MTRLSTFVCNVRIVALSVVCMCVFIIVVEKKRRPVKDNVDMCRRTSPGLSCGVAVAGSAAAGFGGGGIGGGGSDVCGSGDGCVGGGCVVNENKDGG